MASWVEEGIQQCFSPLEFGIPPWQGHWLRGQKSDIPGGGRSDSEREVRPDTRSKANSWCGYCCLWCKHIFSQKNGKRKIPKLSNIVSRMPSGEKCKHFTGSKINEFCSERIDRKNTLIKWNWNECVWTMFRHFSITSGSHERVVKPKEWQTHKQNVKMIFTFCHQNIKMIFTAGF